MHVSTQRRPEAGFDDPILYAACDRVTEVILYGMVVFGPWAFGTTETWAIEVMTWAGNALGALLVMKWLLRRAVFHHPPRWDEGEGHGAQRWLTGLLGVLTVLILGYCLVGAWNARSRYWVEDMRLEYYDCIEWLPHSYDGNRSWFYFRMYLGLAAAFWALRDWLVHKERRDVEGAEEGGQGGQEGRGRAGLLPGRLRRLLWVVSLNGVVLALAGTLQRAGGEGKLLWMVEPRINKLAETQFGPYAYRSNAAQYFNLAWPVCLGLWWSYYQAGRRNRAGHLKRSWQNYHVLLGCGAMMALCPLISTSRAGVVIGAALVAGVGFVLLAGNRHIPARIKGGIAGLAVLTVAGAVEMDWGNLWKRMQDLDQGFAERDRIYELSKQMAADHPVYGTGAGTYATLYQFYRTSLRDTWYAQAHNDWLETRITFGWVGSSLIWLALAVVLARWLAGGGIRAGVRLTGMFWLALAGCLMHARFDFPLQIHSILFLFLMWCAVLMCLTRRA